MNFFKLLLPGWKQSYVLVFMRTLNQNKFILYCPEWLASSYNELLLVKVVISKKIQISVASYQKNHLCCKSVWQNWSREYAMYRNRGSLVHVLLNSKLILNEYHWFFLFPILYQDYYIFAVGFRSKNKICYFTWLFFFWPDVILLD